MERTQNDIRDKKLREINSDTLKHCNYYFTDIQNNLKELTEEGSLNGMPLNWDFLNSIDVISLSSVPATHSIVMKNQELHHKNVLLVLYKIEAFSALLLRGNFDLQLASEIIGSTFYGQTEIWLGYIASFRQDENSPFCKDLLELRKRWKPI